MQYERSIAIVVGLDLVIAVRSVDAMVGRCDQCDRRRSCTRLSVLVVNCPMRSVAVLRPLLTAGEDRDRCRGGFGN